MFNLIICAPILQLFLHICVFQKTPDFDFQYFTLLHTLQQTDIIWEALNLSLTFPHTDLMFYFSARWQKRQFTSKIQNGCLELRKTTISHGIQDL